MPFVHVELIENRTVEQKQAVAQGIVKVLVDNIGVDPNVVTVIFRDLKKTDTYIGGVAHP